MSGTQTRWGIWLHAVRPLPELAEFAARAEALGAAAILVADEGTDRDVYVTLAALAGCTRRALLVSAVSNPHSRHPVAAAAALAALAELAPGRIVAGFGAGGSRVLGPMALNPARPFTALVECIDVVSALLRRKTVDHTGAFSARGASLPWSSGPVPIAIAGRGPRVERLAAERADWILLAGRAVDRLEDLVRRLRATAIGSGRTWPPKIAINPTVAWTQAMLDDVRAHLAYMAVDMPAAERHALGVDDNLRAQLSAVINASGPQVAATYISDAMLARYAVAGDREQVISKLSELRQRIKPELFVFDANDYSIGYLEDLADVAALAGCHVDQRSRQLKQNEGPGDVRSVRRIAQRGQGRS